MFENITLFTSFLTVVCLTTCASPPYITKCKPEDSKCAKETAQVTIPVFASGIAEYGVEQLDPVMFDKVDASSPNLKFILNNVTVTGTKACEAKKIQRMKIEEKSKILLRFLCDTELNGNYELKGQVLFLPVEGKGKAHVALRKTQIDLDLDIVETDGEDGKKHWHIKSWQHSFDLKDKSDVMFHNLFDGNEVLAQAARELFAASGNEIVKEIGSPMMKIMISKVVRNIEHFFKSLPIEDLSLD
uniref:Odorant Binding Protein 35 n=1 Tax=Dendrolimus punctatus TaxID=238572 RepID=A0A2K8GKQ0_9NEOP|nr:Odorant Binding Protein 35 [Dendrolimus punctatus]